MLEQKANEMFGDEDPTGFGTGWWSGVLAAFFGLLAFGAVVCLHFPQLLSSPELRPHYPMPLMRMLIQAVIMAAIILGVASAFLRKKKVLGLTGILFALAATLLGGASVPINETLRDGPAIGLDWFLVGYFLSTHLPLRITSFLILLPATQLTRVLGNARLQEAMGSLPWLVQFFLAVLVADLAEYWIHRALHVVPWLWRFHAIHHSSKSLDWIAGSRAHIVDDLLIRGLMLIPMTFVFSQGIIVAYLLFVTIHATWEHTNFGPSIKWLEPYLIFPRFHHWHHTSQKESIDKNFAIHFPWIDRLFGTYYCPEDRWPDTYGLHNEPIPAGFWGQTFYPFTPRRRRGAR